MVVADTSPLNYLVLIGADGVLLLPYGMVTVPQAVIRELQHPDTPSVVKQWVASPPKWLHIPAVRQIFDPALSALGAGERDAITLARDLGPEVLLLMDETKGRTEAARCSVTTTGTLGRTRCCCRGRFIGSPLSYQPASPNKLPRNAIAIQDVAGSRCRSAKGQND